MLTIDQQIQECIGAIELLKKAKCRTEQKIMQRELIRLLNEKRKTVGADQRVSPAKEPK